VKKNNKLIILVFILAVLIRLFFFSLLPKETRHKVISNDGTDACWYHSLASNIVKNGTYPDGELFRVPVYPYFVSIFYRLFDIKDKNINALPAIVFFQFINSGLVCILLFKIGEILFNRNVGFLASLLLAVNLDDIFYSNIMLSENLFNLFFTLNIYFLVRYFLSNEKNMRYLAGSSIALGPAALTRSIVYYFIFFVIFLIFVKYKHNLKKVVAHSLLAFGIFFIIIFPWMLRNYSLSGAFRLTVPVIFLEENIRILETARLKQDVSSPDVSGINLERLKRNELKELANTSNPKKRFDLLFAYLRKLVLKHPFIYAKTWMTGFFKLYIYQENFNFMLTFFGRFFEGGYKEPFLSGIIAGVKDGWIFFDYNILIPAVIKLSSYFLYVLFYFLMGYGLWKVFLIKDKRIIALLFLGVIIYFPFLLGILGFTSFARYRMPAVPMILMCSAIGLYFLSLKFRKRNSGFINHGEY